MDQARLNEIRTNLINGARNLGKTIQDHAAQEIVDLHGAARNSIIFAALVCGFSGTALGFFLGKLL